MKRQMIREDLGGQTYEYLPLGRFVVSAPGVCRGRPTFKYTRIEVAHLLEWLSGPPSALTVIGDSEVDASAFVAAALCRPADDRTQRLSRAVRCWDQDALREVANKKTGHLIIHDAQDTTVVGSAVVNGHHVVVPVGRGGLRSSDSKANLDLPAPARESFVQSLMQIGRVAHSSPVLA